MEKVIGSKKVPIKIWANDVDEGTEEQLMNLSELPFVFKHIALMPDGHKGYGMPIGGVMCTKNVVVPNAVGVDIGCGMCFVESDLDVVEKDVLKKIMGRVREVIPVGFKHHKEDQDVRLPRMDSMMNYDGYSVLNPLVSSAKKQLGTLGGGNHFVELQKNEDGKMCVMIHSGSRNVGFKVAKHFNDLAKELNEKWCSSVPKKHELAFLPLDSDEGRAYMDCMNYCVEFALLSRKLMIDRVQDAIREFCPDVKFGEVINVAHNYAKMENHFGKNVMVHRKGATRAYEGEIGIIPGSQGTSSYIVKGRGNVDSFKSCSHGAGRKMGRKQAQRTLDFDEEVKKLDDLGVIHSIRNKKDLDEAAGSYKDIDVVMDNQSDLVEIVSKLTPLAVIKG